MRKLTIVKYYRTIFIKINNILHFIMACNSKVVRVHVCIWLLNINKLYVRCNVLKYDVANEYARIRCHRSTYVRQNRQVSFSLSERAKPLILSPEHWARAYDDIRPYVACSRRHTSRTDLCMKREEHFARGGYLLLCGERWSYYYFAERKRSTAFMIYALCSRRNRRR